MDGKEIKISKGDYITFPAGSIAHQIINSSDITLRYLCSSPIIEPDVVVYPDSKKVGIFVGLAPGASKEKPTLHKYLRGEAEIDYEDGKE